MSETPRMQQIRDELRHLDEDDPPYCQACPGRCSTNNGPDTKRWSPSGRRWTQSYPAAPSVPLSVPR